MFIVVLAMCLTSYVGPPSALLLGLIVAQTSGHPFLKFNQQAINWLLKSSVVGLGFGMNFHNALLAGQEGLIYTIASISLTLLAGWLIGRALKVEWNISYLISTGTAICGGSAIAAIGPIIKSNERQMSVALGCVFILNAAALFIFPVMGNWLELTQAQFGLWCAIAIHDTSSVVGAAVKYGEEAVQIATTVKMQRALWIIPLSVFTMLGTKGSNGKISIPYFIGLFCLAMLASTYFQGYQNQFDVVVMLAKKGLTVTLFLIGAGLSMKTLKSVGIRPMIQALIIWVIISIASLVSIILVD